MLHVTGHSLPRHSFHSLSSVTELSMGMEIVVSCGCNDFMQINHNCTLGISPVPESSVYEKNIVMCPIVSKNQGGL